VRLHGSKGESMTMFEITGTNEPSIAHDVLDRQREQWDASFAARAEVFGEGASDAAYQETEVLWASSRALSRHFEKERRGQ